MHDRPNFFIVGAPRSGTTALSRYISQHPQICLSRPKETHFLFRPVANCTYSSYLAHYWQQFFPHCHANHCAVGEGSVSYIYFDQILHRILTLQPDARFIVMVRNPIELLRSYHWRLLYLLEEDRADFREAWSLQQQRLHGQCLPLLCRDSRLLQYAEIGKLGQRIERLFEIAGRDRCLVLVFDDFVRDPRASYQQVCRFLGVADDGRARFPRRHESQSYRSRWLQRWLFHPPPSVLRWASNPARHGRFWPWQKLVLSHLHRRVSQLNATRQNPPPFDAEMAAQLRATFVEDVECLSQLLGRDLTPWVSERDRVHT